MGELGLWQSHKKVRAGRIMKPVMRNDTVAIIEDVHGAPTTVSLPMDIFARGVPVVGDYIVIYRDAGGNDGAYKSWSPAAEFEDGYTLLVSSGEE